MIPTSAVVADLTRPQKETTVAAVEEILAQKGLLTKEISQRLAMLSQEELNQMGTQIKEARAGGDILITVLLVLLIIYVAKRI
jgi:hypothetical protein